jgi:hypothetical protein
MTTQERVPGVTSVIPTQSCDYEEKSGILQYIFKICWSLVLASRQEGDEE